MIVTAMSLCTPLGLTTVATQRACAARISRATAVDDRPKAPVVTRLSLLPEDLHREDRMLVLLGCALRQLDAALPASLPRPLPCFLALPEFDEDLDFNPGRWLADLQRSPEGPRIDVAPPRCHLTGRAAFFHALAAATAYVEEAGARSAVALVAAADCLADQRSARALYEAGRLLGDKNPDGILPGEAAGVFAVMSERTAAALRLRPEASLGPLFTAQEAEPHGVRIPVAADALTEVFRAIRLHPRLLGRRADRILSCQPSTSPWAQEFGAAYLRNAAMMPEPLDHRGLSPTLGEVGAAAGLCQLALAIDAFHPPSWRTRLPLRDVVLHGASDEGDCAACLFQHPEPRTI